MFIAALFTIANVWKQPRCLTTDEQIKIFLYTFIYILYTFIFHLYTMEFYSPTKKNEILFASKWIELENIILSEVRQVQKAKSCMLFLLCRL
jgi:hypothetical protein